MDWNLVWAVIAVAAVVLVSYGIGFVNGFKEGVDALRKKVEAVLNEEMEKANERKKTS